MNTLHTPMVQYLRKLLIFTLFIVALLPAWAVDITITTDDPTSVELLYGCEVFTESGTYSVEYGDEVRTLNLTIVCTKSTYSTQEATIELGQSYLFQCDVLTPEEAGDSEHTYTLENAAGCDSIITLTLHTLAPEPEECDTARYAYKDSIYEGETYLFVCQELTEEGEYTERLRKADNSCDSIVTLTLTYIAYDSVREYKLGEQDHVACKGYEYTTISGKVLTVNANLEEFTDTLVDYLPMRVDAESHRNIYTDSVVTYRLSVWMPTDSTLRDSIELGDPYTFDDEEFTPTEEGFVYREMTVPNMHGCDSVVTLELKVIKVDTLREYVFGSVEDALCAGGEYEAGSKIVVVNQDTLVTDTMFAIRTLKDDELHTLTYIDSVTTYALTAWQPSDSTVQDSIELGDPYTFDDEEFTPTEEGFVYREMTVPNMYGCDSVVTLELKVIKVDTLHEYVYSTVQDTLCLGETYTAGSKELVIGQDTVVVDTVFAVQKVKDDALHTLTYTDSVTTYTLRAWHNELVSADALNWGNAFCGEAYSGAAEVLSVLRESIEADELFRKDTVLAFLYKDATGAYVPYTGTEMKADMNELALRATVSNSCGTHTYDKVLAIDKPDYELSTLFDNLPAVSKYGDWLLMVDVDSLNKVYGLHPAADSVRWYRISGAEPNIDNDQYVGSGYYYTNDKQLTGSYYAIIGLPVQTDECGGQWRSRIVVQTSSGAPLRIAPSIAKTGTPVNLYHLPVDEISTLQVYAADGKCVKTITHNPSADNMDGVVTIVTDTFTAGVYTIRVVGGNTKAALRFIITQ